MFTMIGYERFGFLFLLITFICTVGVVSGMVKDTQHKINLLESLVIEDPTAMSDGQCWCCGCGWQSCSACANNSKLCCPNGMGGFVRYNFDNGNIGGGDKLDLIGGASSMLSGIDNVPLDKTEKNPDGTLSYQQRQLLIAALEKAGIQPYSLTAEQIKMLLREAELGVQCGA